MRHFRFYLKVIPIFVAAAIMQAEPELRKDLLLSAASLLLAFAIVVSLFSRVWKKSRGIYHHTGILPLFYPGAILFLVSLHTTVPREKKDPPSLWYESGSTIDQPEYNRALFTRVQIRESSARSGYLTEANILYEEKTIKKRIYYGGRSGKKKYNTHKKKSFSGRDRTGKQKRPRRYSLRKKGYRKKYYKKEIIRYELSADQKNPFDLFLSINDDTLFPGCELLLKVYGRAIPTLLPKNSYGKYLQRMGATTMLRVSAKYHLVSKSCPPPTWDIFVRRRVLQAVRSAGFSVDGEGAALGMLLGDSSYMSREFRKQSAGAGIMHLFAASGLHLGIFYGVLYAPLAFFRGKKTALALLFPLPFAFLFMAVPGFPVTLIRAFLFLTINAFRSIIHRSVRKEDHIINTATGILLFFPESFVSLSSLFSFGAVTGILYFHSQISRILAGPAPRRIRSFVATQLAISLSATLLLVPLTVGVFGMHSFISPLVNLVAVPLASILLPGLYTGVILDLAGLQTVSSVVLFLCKYGIDWFVWISGGGSLFGSYRTYSGFFAFPVLIDFALFMFLVFLRFEEKNDRRLSGAGKVGAILCILLLSSPGAYLSSMIGNGSFFGFESILEKSTDERSSETGNKLNEAISVSRQSENSRSL